MRWRNLLWKITHQLTGDQRDRQVMVYDPFYDRVLRVVSIGELDEVRGKKQSADSPIVLIVSRDRE